MTGLVLDFHVFFCTFNFVCVRESVNQGVDGEEENEKPYGYYQSNRKEIQDHLIMIVLEEK